MRQVARQQPLSAFLANLTFDDMTRLGDVLAASKFFKDSTQAAQCVVKILYGAELGIGPVTAMMGIHIIDGKPSLSANLLASRVKTSERYDYRVREHTAETATVEFFERGESLGVSRWTAKEAAQAGLAGKQNWKNYPRQMLFSRAMSEGVRTFCPDLFGGAPVYTPEELGAEVDGESGEPILMTADGTQVYRETGEVVPGLNPAAQKAVESAETQASYAGAMGVRTEPQLATADPTADEKKKACARYGIAMVGHWPETKKDRELRHALAAAVCGYEVPVNNFDQWSAANYNTVANKIKAHAQECPGGDECSLFATARQMLKPAPEDPFVNDEGGIPAQETAA